MIDLFEDKFFKKGSNGLELDKKVVSAAGNYYDILGVSEDAPMEIIKMAIEKAMIKYHPDNNHSKLEGETESEHEIRKEKANSIFIYVRELVLTIAKQREIQRET